jgi:hypothetical protein
MMSSRAAWKKKEEKEKGMEEKEKEEESLYQSKTQNISAFPVLHKELPETSRRKGQERKEKPRDGRKVVTIAYFITCKPCLEGKNAL